MRERNKNLILEKGFIPDTKIKNMVKDSRKGIGLFALGDFKLNENFNKIYEEAKVEFSGQVLYSPMVKDRAELSAQGSLHHTFMQFEKVGDNEKDALLLLIDSYKNGMAQTILDIGPIEVEYQGLIAIPSGILMYGYPDKDVNSFREKIRNLNLDIKEPYKSDIVHSTFIRLCENINTNKLLDFADKYSKVNLGNIYIKKLFLGIGSWRMGLDEISMRYKFDLVNKKVTSLITNA